jgi:hypothetical protein
MAQEHIDDRRARAWLQQRLGQEVPLSLYRRLLQAVGYPPWSRAQEGLALMMAREALGAPQSRKKRLKRLRGQLERRVPVLTRLVQHLGPDWGPALAELDQRFVRTPLELIRFHFFGTPNPPLPAACTAQQVEGLLRRLAQQPRRGHPWQLLFSVLPGFAAQGFLTVGQRFRMGDYVATGAELAGSALGELVELARGLSFFLGISPQEVVDYIITGAPPYGLPWADYGDDGTVLVGGSREGVAKLAQLLGRWVPPGAFEAFAKETAGLPWPERLERWNREYAPRFGHPYRTVSALRKAMWEAGVRLRKG